MVPFFRIFTNAFESMFCTFLDVLATDKTFATIFYPRIWGTGLHR